MKTVISSRGPEVDVQKCIKVVGGNRFDLIIIAAERARIIAKEQAKNKVCGPTVVTALLEIQNAGQ